MSLELQLQELQKKHDQLVEYVRRMRGCQKDYFKYRAKSDLEKSKQWERRVDEMIKKEVQEQKSNQGQILF